MPKDLGKLEALLNDALPDTIAITEDDNPNQPNQTSGEIVEQRTITIRVKITPTERQRLEAICQGKTFSGYIRARIFDYPISPPREIVPEVNRAVYVELQRISRNVNQQTKLLHQAVMQNKLDLEIHLAELQAISGLINQLRRGLIIFNTEDTE